MSSPGPSGPALAGLAALLLVVHVGVLDALGAARARVVAVRVPAVQARFVDPEAQRAAATDVVAVVPTPPPDRPVVAPRAAVRRARAAPAVLPAPAPGSEAGAPTPAAMFESVAFDDERLAAAPPALAGSEVEGEGLPVYPTKPPDAFAFDYDLRRGLLGGRGTLSLRLLPDGYEARLQGRVAGFSILELTSRGGIDAAGFAPLRYTDQRRGRAVQAANFQRAAGRITYSGTRSEAPLPPGAQDRLSWMLQLAAIARARPQRLVEGERIAMFVSGARGDADAWTFTVGAPLALETPAGTVAHALPLTREPRRQYDTRAQVWLDPARQYLPVKARLQSTREGGEALELLLEAVRPSP